MINSEFDCIICMGTLNDPVIGSDGNVYCRKCIEKWQKKGTIENQEIKEWAKCLLFDKVYSITQIKSDLNLFRIMNQPDRECDDANEAMKIIDMIKNENESLLEDDDRQDDIPESYVMKKIFEKEKMIRSILSHLSEEWTDSNNWNLLHYICAYGSYPVIHWTLTHMNFNLNSETLFSHSVLYFLFAKTNQLKQSELILIFEFLVEKNVLDKIDEKMIIYLCSDQSKLDSKNQLIMMKKFINDKEFMNNKHSYYKKRKSLHIIIQCFSCNNNLNSQDQLEIIQYLISNNINLNFSFQGSSPIHFVTSKLNKLSSEHQLKAIKLMINHTIDLETKTNHSWRPIHFVCSNDNNMTSKDQLEAIKIMIDHKVDLDAMNSAFWAPIHFVCSKDNNLISKDQMEAINMMIDHQVALDVRNIELWKPIHYVTSSSCNLESSEQLSIIKKMIEMNIDLEAKNNHSWCPVHFISSDSCNLKSKDQLEAIRMFIKKGVNFDVENQDAWRPIHFVSSFANKMESYEQMEAIRDIIAVGVKLDVMNNDGMTPIHYVSGNQNYMDSNHQCNAITKFIEFNADLNLMNNDFMRPIHFVLGESNMVYKDMKKIITLFVEKKVDTDVYTLQGKSPIDVMANNRKLYERERNKLAMCLFGVTDFDNE